MALRALGLVFGGACFSLPSRPWPAQILRATKGDEDATWRRHSCLQRRHSCRRRLTNCVFNRAVEEDAGCAG